MKEEILKQLEIEDIFNNKKHTFIDEFKNIIGDELFNIEENYDKETNEKNIKLENL